MLKHYRSKHEGIRVISVILNLHYREIFRHIFRINMKVSSILVVNVIIKLRKRVILMHI